MTKFWLKDWQNKHPAQRRHFSKFNDDFNEDAHKIWNFDNLNEHGQKF